MYTVYLLYLCIFNDNIFQLVLRVHRSYAEPALSVCQSPDDPSVSLVSTCNHDDSLTTTLTFGGIGCSAFASLLYLRSFSLEHASDPPESSRTCNRFSGMQAQNRLPRGRHRLQSSRGFADDAHTGSLKVFIEHSSSMSSFPARLCQSFL